jgi:hypothetical protein
MASVPVLREGKPVERVAGRTLLDDVNPITLWRQQYSVGKVALGLQDATAVSLTSNEARLPTVKDIARHNHCPLVSPSRPSFVESGR